MSGPLDGVRVVEMANVITGPYACMLLADLGAEVVKVELPVRGDVFRYWATDEHPISPAFAAFNRDKKSVTIDVSTARGAELYLRLAGTADVVVENFRPGTLDRLAVGYDAVRARNQGIIYCSISGTGQSGPDSQRPTYDAIAQAMSGLWSQFIDMAQPEPIGPAICDQLAALYAVYGVLGAVVHRTRTGQGQRLNVSMLGAAISFQTSVIATYLMEGAIPDRSSRAKRSQTYAFVARDGRPFAIHLSTPDKFWRGLAEAVGRLDLIDDPRFRSKSDRIANYAALQAELAEVFKSKDRAEAIELLRRHDVPVAAINTLAEALDEPQVKDQGLIRRFGGDHGIELVGSPVDYEATPFEPGDPPPAIGQHTDSILSAIGVGRDELSVLREERVI